MYSLLKKEITSFFGSLTGYIVIGVFLLANSMFLWVFDNDMNILNSGYATLNGMFEFAPWIFLFLVPAITMRMFAEEAKSGTLELLLTHPLTDFQIVFSKYLASLVLILAALLPTLIYFFSVYALGDPVGNIDTGGTWGSYIGLFFLAAIYAAIGVFASVVTNNQIISFIIALITCFFFYMGFDSISTVGIFKPVHNIIGQLGISEHYRSMSRGVIDTRDMFYFVGVAFVFIYTTQTIVSFKRK